MLDNQRPFDSILYKIHHIMSFPKSSCRLTIWSFTDSSIPVPYTSQYNHNKDHDT
jgi:hypothetical protein